MNLKEIALSWQNKKASGRTAAGRENVPFAQATSIGILFHADAESHINTVAGWVQQLEKDHRKVKVMAFASQLLSIGNRLTLSEFTNKDISTLGEIRQKAVQDFMRQEFDYLFCLHNQAFLPFDYIMLRSHAKCRVGRFEENKTGLYELMIEMPECTPLSDLLTPMLDLVRKM
jgi:hypothetical protein